MSAPGLLLRPAAAELGISRKTLLRYIAEGLPVARKSERVYVDIEEARAWIALNEDFVDGSPKLAPVLHPDDPRWRERAAVAKIGELELALQRGALLRVEDVHRLCDNEMAAFRNMVQYLHRYLGAEVGHANGAEVASALEAPLAEITKPFRPDAPFPFPPPRPEPEPDYDFEGGERETLPKLASGDPRYDVAVVTMQRREAEHVELRAACVPWTDARDWRAECHAIVIKHADQIAAKVAKELGDVPADRAAINDVVDAAGDGALRAMQADFERASRA